MEVTKERKHLVTLYLRATHVIRAISSLIFKNILLDFYLFVKFILGATQHGNVFQAGGNVMELLTAKIFLMKKIARIASVPNQSLGVMTVAVLKDLSG